MDLSFDTLSDFIAPAFVHRMGWLLVHSLWQFSVVGILTWLVLRVLPAQSAETRYRWLTLAMLSMILAPLLTWKSFPNDKLAASAADKIDDVGFESAIAPVTNVDIDVFDETAGVPLGRTSMPSSARLDHTPPTQMVGYSGWSPTMEQRLTPWLLHIVVIWSIGVICCSLRPLLGWLNVHRLRTQGVSPVDGSIEKMLRNVASRMDVQRRVTVLQSTLVNSPIVVGCFHSVILLPASLISNLPAQQLKALLAHELAHVRRYDYLANLVQAAIETLFFYHPAVWWISTRMRVERELCCDDWVVKTMSDRVEYGRALLAIEEYRDRSLALAASDGSLLDRIRRICEGNTPSRRSAAKSLTGMLGITIASVTLVSAVMVTMVWTPRIAQAAESATVVVNGRSVDPDGNAVVGASVTAVSRYGAITTATTDVDGKFELKIPESQFVAHVTVVDTAKEYIWHDQVVLQSPPGSGYKEAPFGERPGLDKPLAVEMKPAWTTEVTVVDGSGKPVQGATVASSSSFRPISAPQTDINGVTRVTLPADKPMQWVTAFKPGSGYDYFSTDVRDANNYPIKDPPKMPRKLRLVLDGARSLRIQAVDATGTPIPNIAIRPWYIDKEERPGETNFNSSAYFEFTGEDGVAEFEWIPPKVKRSVTFWITSEDYTADRLTISDAEIGAPRVHEWKLTRKAKIAGLVLLPDGKPATSVDVVAKGTGPNESGSGVAQTDSQGRFTMPLDANMSYVVHVQHGNLVGYVSPVTVLDGKPSPDTKIQLQRGTVVHGRVTRGTPPRPLPAERVGLRLELGRVPDEIERLKDANDNFYRAIRLFRHTTTDAAGNFRIVAAPGKYVLSGPTHAKTKVFTIVDQDEVSHDFHVPREEFMQFTGTARDALKRPAVDASMMGIYASAVASRHSFSGQTDSKGAFSIERESQPAMVRVQSADKAFATIVKVGEGDNGVRFDLKPTFATSGRLLDEQGNPLSDATIKYGVNVHMGDDNAPFMTSFGGKVQTDEKGRFVLKELVQDVDWSITLEESKNGPWSRIQNLRHDTDEDVDLGDCRVQRPARSRTFAEKVHDLFARQESLAKRLKNAKIEAEREYLRIAIIVADGESDSGEVIYRLLRGNSRERKLFDKDTIRTIRGAKSHYQMMYVDASKTDELKKVLGRNELDSVNGSYMVLLDSDATWLSCVTLPDSIDDGKSTSALLTAGFQRHQLPTKDAKSLFEAAKAKATSDNKTIFLQETASWCGPCRVLSRFIEEHADIFDKHFVWIKIDRERQDHAEEIMQAIRLEKSRSIPWIAILKSDGEVLGASSQNTEDSDDNYGFPSDRAAIDRFMTMLQESRPQLSEKELNTLRLGLDKQ